MAPTLSDICTRSRRAAALLCFAVGLWCAGVQAASALTRTELYQAVAPVADRSENAQAAAFQAAMRIVLIRVTGRRTAGEEAVFAPLMGNARRYVQQYRSTPEGKLWVSFDGPAIERWLGQNGQPLWGHERPSTLVWLTTGGGAVVTADDTADLKASIDAAAVVRGVPLLWPSAADVQRNSPPADLAHRMGADGVLVGRADSAGVHWTLSCQDHALDAAGALEGVNRAADTYAATFAASGALAPVDIEIGGIADLHAYAGAESYLESLTFISHVSVQALSGDVVTFRVMTRGGAEPLQRAIGLSGRLQPEPAGSNGVQRFQWRR